MAGRWKVQKRKAERGERKGGSGKETGEKKGRGWKGQQRKEKGEREGGSGKKRAGKERRRMFINSCQKDADQ